MQFIPYRGGADRSLFVGTQAGLDILDIPSGEFRHVSLIPAVRIYDIQEDSDGMVWIATYGDGLWVYNPRTDKYVRYMPGSGKLTCLCVAYDGRIWCGTEGKGAFIFDKSTLSFRRFGHEEGLPNDIISFIVEDSGFNMWIGTNRVLAKLEQDGRVSHCYFKSDGLQSNLLSTGAAFVAIDGKIYMGGTGGFNAVSPKLERQNEMIPDIRISSVYVMGDRVGVPSGRLLLKPVQTAVAFDISVLSYASHESGFAYRMDGIDKDWIIAGSNRHLSYNLRPGRYRLRIIGCNGSQLGQEERTLEITMRRPFFASTFMIIVYVLIILVIIFFIVQSLKDRSERQHKEELMNFKISFFTNIIRDIRTPLTLVKGPLEELMADTPDDSPSMYALSMMKRNVDALNKIIDQKIESSDAGPLARNHGFQGINLHDDERKGYPAVLVADGNSEVLTFIISSLGNDYDVLTASDSGSALDILKDNVVVCVVADTALPGSSGFGLCRQIRENEILRHLPVILYSSQTDATAKISGMESGADAFVEKPFTAEHLRSAIASVVKNRNAIKDIYSSGPAIAPQILASNTSDMRFINKVNGLIIANLSMDTVDLTELICKEFSVGKSAIRKRIKAITGEAPTEYIRQIRIRKAAELLKTTDMRVNEIAFAVGFSTPSYFSRCFFEQFGCQPKEMRS